MVTGGADPVAPFAETVSVADEGRQLWALADRCLSEDQRSALWLRYAEDLGYGEIGKILGRPAVTVRVLLFRAREILGRQLASGDLENPPEPGSRKGALAVHNGGTP